MISLASFFKSHNKSIGYIIYMKQFVQFRFLIHCTYFKFFIKISKFSIFCWWIKGRIEGVEYTFLSSKEVLTMCDYKCTFFVFI